MAVNNPDLNFFGIEVYETGVARTCSKIEESGIKNLKIYLGDVVDLILDKDIETTFDLLLFLFPILGIKENTIKDAFKFR